MTNNEGLKAKPKDLNNGGVAIGTLSQAENVKTVLENAVNSQPQKKGGGDENLALAQDLYTHKIEFDDGFLNNFFNLIKEAIEKKRQKVALETMEIINSKSISLKELKNHINDILNGDYSEELILQIIKELQSKGKIKYAEATRIITLAPTKVEFRKFPDLK